MSKNTNNPFVLPNEEYTRNIDPVKNAVEDYTTYLQTKHGISHEEARQFVTSTLMPGGCFEFKDKMMTLLERKENGDRELVKKPVRRFIADIIKRDLIVAPTWTVYLPSSVRSSFLGENIELGIADRNKAKKAMYHAESIGDKIGYVHHNLDQGNKKIRNNSVSGMQCTASTAMMNRTGHSTLTSICRNTSGLGNVNNERLITGNRHYRNQHITLNNIVSIVRNTNYKTLRGAMEKYDLHYPTAEEALECIRYSSDLYWRNDGAIAYILDYFHKLTPIQRAAVVYTGDLCHLRKHNEEMVRKLFTDLIQKKNVNPENPMGIVKSAPESYLFLAQQICTDEVKGIGLDHKQIEGKPELSILASTILHIVHVVDVYSDFIKAFLVTPNLPPSVAYLPAMLRRTALVSDTDSTLMTMKDWIIWYCGKIDFTPVGISVQAAMTFFASSNIAHVLATMSKNMGVETKNLKRIAMKSEFRFDVFIMTMLGKHYFALIGCQEGSVYEKHKVEIKGVHLKSSQITKELTSQSEKMMVDIMYDILNKGTVSMKTYIERVRAIEQHVMAQIRAGNKDYFKAASIKDAESYTKDEEESPYQLHTAWQMTFGKKYGLMPDPPYRTIKISLDIGGPAKLKAWIASIKDADLQKWIRHWVAVKEKKNFSTFTMPEEMFVRHGIIDEIKDVVDVRKITMELCTSFYLVLETMSLFFVGDKHSSLVSEIYPADEEVMC